MNFSLKFLNYKAVSLKGQKPPANMLRNLALGKNPRLDMKPHHYQQFLRITDTETQKELLQDLVDGRMNLKEFAQECGLVARRQVVQQEFVRATGVKTWERATTDYRLHTSSQAIVRFSFVDLKRTKPETWWNFINSAKKSRDQSQESKVISLHLYYLLFFIWLLMVRRHQL